MTKISYEISDEDYQLLAARVEEVNATREGQNPPGTPLTPETLVAEVVDQYLRSCREARVERDVAEFRAALWSEDASVRVAAQDAVRSVVEQKPK